MSARRAPIFEAVVVAGARTPMAALNTHFKDLTEVELGAIAGREALRRSGADPKRVDHVVFGNAMQTSGNALYGARHVGLKAGLPETVPALTVNRLCGSGIQSIVTAASLLQLEEAEIVLAGGMENMTQAPHVARGLRSGLRMGHARLEDSLLVGLMDTHCGCAMAQTAENLAIERGITREEADRYALRSLALEKGVPCLFCDVQDLLRQLQATFDRQSGMTELELLQPVLLTEMVLLDDLGGRQFSPWVEETLSHIVTTRYNENRATLVTTNYMDEPREKRDPTLKDRIGPRVYSRLQEMCHFVKVEAADFRVEVKRADLHWLPERRGSPEENA